MGFRLINGFLLGICHESYPEADAWAIFVNIGPLEIIFGKNLAFYDEDEE
jgi:hypothetical protein